VARLPGADAGRAAQLDRSAACGAVVGSASEALVTGPVGDEATRQAFGGHAIDDLDDDAVADTDLGRLRRYIFTEQPPPERPRTGDVRLFSAPGEGREALEIARVALDEAARGVRFDEMAVCLRAPQPFVGLAVSTRQPSGCARSFRSCTRRAIPLGVVRRAAVLRLRKSYRRSA
jgi:hypothetical protein